MGIHFYFTVQTYTLIYTTSLQDCYMADQMWTGCADVSIVSSSSSSSSAKTTTSCAPTPSNAPVAPVAPVAPTSPPPCVDLPLPEAWSGGGLYNCDAYESHGGTAYCAHSE